MKVLIIGGTGLISTAITKQLVQRGDDVTLFNRGQSPNRAGQGAKCLHGDRRDYAAFESLMAQHTWDGVIDMIGFGPDDELSAIRAFQGRVGHFIFTSTVCVYGGEVTTIPTREDEPHTPTNDYGRNKSRCEDVLNDAFVQQKFPATIIRPSQTYGEGGTIVHTLGWNTGYIDRLRKGKPVIVHGDGSNLWVSCHIDDVARAYLGALDNPKSIGRTYNVTGEVAQTWDDYNKGVAQAVGAPAPQIVHIPTDVLGQVAPKRAGITVEIFQYNSVFDNSAAKRDLGFQYTVPFVDGMRRTTEWLDANNRIDNSDEDPFEDDLIAAWRNATINVAAQVQEP